MDLSHSPVRWAALAALVSTLLFVILAVAPFAAAKTTGNAAGRYDALVLRDLGDKQAAVVQMVAGDGAFSPVEVWRSRKGAFDARKATFVAGDVNGDGIGDGIALVDLGRGRSRLDVFLSDGVRAVQNTAWTSKAGAFFRTKAKLAVGDLNRDGRDDLIALYARGRSGAALYRFISTGAKFKQSTAWSAASGFSWSRAQLAAGDATGDGRDDAIVLYGSTATSSQLYVFVTGDTKSTRQTFWRGAYAAGRAKLVAGDADSDGVADAICVYKKPDNSGRLDVFRSTKQTFAAPAVWYEQRGGPPVPIACRLAVGDLTGDGRADIVTAAASGGSATRMTTWVSNGLAFAPQVWWEDTWSYAKLSLGIAPSVGLVVADGAEVLNSSSMRYLRRVEADGTLTFAGETGQLGRLEQGDVVLAGASPEFPNGICRTVTSVGEQDGRVVVETAPAALDDVIDQGEVAFDMHVTADDVPDDGIRAPGVRLEREPAPPAGTLPVALGGDNAEGLHFTLTGTILEVAEAEGEVWIDPNAYCDWDIGWTGLESAYYTQELHVTADLTVSCKQTLTGKRETTLYKRTLSVITIMVGPVPVVVTPVFEVKIGVEGEITAGVTAGLSIDTMASAGITYDDDGWGTSTGWSYTATPHPPQLFGELEVTGFASAGLAFEIYGVAGPEASLKPYVKLASDVEGDPWWTLSAGLNGEIGFKVEVLDKEVFSKTFELHFFEEEIDRAGSDASGGGSTTYQTPSVKGRILDTTTGQAIRSASVEIEADGSALSHASSAADGTYVLSGLSPGTYTVTARKDNYATNTRSVTVAAGQTTQGQDVRLTRVEFQGISGHVFTEAGGYPMFDATVKLYEVDEFSWLNDYRSDWTGTDGFYKFEDVDPGTYRIVAEHSYYFPESMIVTLSGGQMLEDKDLRLVQHMVQGVSGWVVEDLTGHAISGALVSVRDGDEEGGYGEADMFTGADGSFVLTGLGVGTHWIRVSKPGYVDVLRSFTVRRAEITRLGNIVLKPPGGQSMRASGQDSWIRWTEGVSSWPWGTYEFWFRPLDWGYMEYGNVLAEVSVDYPDWMGEGPHRWPIMRIQYGSAEADPDVVVFTFGINENKDDEHGAWHWVRATTPLELGHWYHVAAVFGLPGMRLFVNGFLEGSNDYGGAPQANNGASPGGWFSIGGNDTFPGYQTAVGDFRGLCVAEEPRYDADFYPPDTPSGSSALVLDFLAGMTNGENSGFEPTP